MKRVLFSLKCEHATESHLAFEIGLLGVYARDNRWNIAHLPTGYNLFDFSFSNKPIAIELARLLSKGYNFSFTDPNQARDFCPGIKAWVIKWLERKYGEKWESLV